MHDDALMVRAETTVVAGEAISTGTGTAAPAVPIAVVTAWCLMGVLLGVLAGRRGHDGPAFATLGFVLGPLLVPLLAAARREAQALRPIVLAHGEAGSGAGDVVVACCGPATAAAIEQLRSTRRAPPRHIVVAGAVDYESLRFGAPSFRARRVLHDLVATVHATPPPKPRAVVVPGNHEAVARYARDENAAFLRCDEIWGTAPGTRVIPPGRCETPSTNRQSERQ